MRIVTLIENSPGAAGCRHEHGLSFYIETRRHRLLLDTGAGGGFLHNAAVLGIGLRDVDSLFLSHGHYDHGGGILDFAAANPAAPIYMQRTAGLEYYAVGGGEPRYIGLDRKVLGLRNLVLLDGDCELDGELAVLSGITGRRRQAKSNLELKRKDGERLVQDSFAHEQALVVRQDGKRWLFSGCAHSGILNFLDRFREKYGADPDAVVSGFHFMKAGDYMPEELEDITETARELSRMETVFYTGHCTGRRAFALMKPIMGNRLHALHSGMEIKC